MKYENFKQVQSLVNQIEKHQRNLDFMNDYTEVHIVQKYGERIFTIGTDNNCEHEYLKRAQFLVLSIKTDLQDRINNLKSMLEIL